jgi:hypothetical protein
MRLVAEAGTVTHVDFYASVAAVYSLIFISINVVGLGDSKLSDSGPSGNPDKWIWPAIAVGVTFGVAIPLAILASFLQDTELWRVLAFIMLVLELLVAVFIAGLNLATPRPSGRSESGDQL